MPVQLHQDVNNNQKHRNIYQPYASYDPSLDSSPASSWALGSICDKTGDFDDSFSPRPAVVGSSVGSALVLRNA